MKLPDFLLIGAMKSGTTPLYFGLSQHPQIFLSGLKEPNFFAAGDDLACPPLEGGQIQVRDLESYAALFAGARDRVAGEASTSYLYLPETPARIRARLPEAGLIAMLRNPVERAYSHFLWQVRDGRETLRDFRQALAAEDGRRAAGAAIGHYFHRGLYHGQLRRYYDLFERQRIRVYLLDDLLADPAELWRDLLAFLGVDEGFVPDTTIRRNVSGIPRNALLNRLLTRPNPLRKVLQPLLPAPLYRLATRLRDRNLAIPPMPEDVRGELVERYRPEVRRLQDLLGRDLSAWLE